MADDQSSVKPGVQTSEAAVAKTAIGWSILGMVLGLITTVGASVAEFFGHDTKAALIAGAVITAAALLSKTLVSLGYIKSRTDVKVADATGPSPDAKGGAAQ